MMIGLVATDGRVFAGMITVDFDDARKWTAGSEPINNYASNHVY